MIRRWLRLLVLAVVPVLLAPASALACAVCGLTTGRNLNSFLYSTLFLSLLPLGLLAAGVWWLARNARAFLKSEFTESEDAVVEPTHESAPPVANEPHASTPLSTLPPPDPARG